MYVAPPMRMGAWSMARVLRQRIEYYIYCVMCRCVNLIASNDTLRRVDNELYTDSSKYVYLDNIIIIILSLIDQILMV